MGKVLGTFSKGFPGAASRSNDEVIVSLVNAGTTDIEFGAPVFLTGDGKGVQNFLNTDGGGTPQTFEKFVGFAVRAANKTPDDYPTSQDYNVNADSNNQHAVWHPGEAVDVLVRGSIIVKAATGFLRGGKVWIRKTDGRLMPAAGAEGSTVWLENCRCSTPQTSQQPYMELLVTSRNIQ